LSKQEEVAMKMNDSRLRRAIISALMLSTCIAGAQSVNTWRGDESGADWNDRYKWKLKHAPSGEEAAHFRESNSSITINSTVQLNNGMHLYGQELSLRGNGNINLQSQIPHQRTVNIPASATGFANMTIRDNLTLNGRIALSAKGFGTSSSKGSVTLRDRSNVNGSLSIGNNGRGTGQVFVKGSSTYHITGLELKTKADTGGLAEIHVLGGTVYIETKENPYNIFLEDPSRKIILGDSGTLRIEFIMPISQKKREVKAMILEDRVVAAPGCTLTLPVIQNDMMILRGEDARNGSKYPTKQALMAAIDQISNNSSIASEQPRKLDSILSAMRGSSTPKSAPAASSDSAQNQVITNAEEQSGNGGKMAGYIVFFGTVLLALRRADEKQEEK